MTVLSRGVLVMSAANAVALGTTIASYFLYSRLLTPADFGVYAGALAIAKLGTTLLDGGLKTSLIKSHETVEPTVLRGLFLGSCGAGLAVLLLLSIVLGVLASAGTLSASTAAFFFLYGAAYFATYPFLFIPLAQLEREQRYSPVARSEALSISIEYGLPALLWWLVAPGFWSFVVGAWLGRLLRSGLILHAAENLSWLSRHVPANWFGMWDLFKEGLGLQLAVLASMLRDSLHLIIIGPWFGKEWVGMYAWALQLCAVASQVFVQTATRVSLPALRLTQGSHSRWRATMIQVGWLCMLMAPPLVLLTDLATAANRELFRGQWTEALALLPLLVFRMLPGLATTPVGSLVLAECSASAYARASIVWSITEVLVALIFIAWIGPMGLAWSYSIMAWFGLACLIRALPAPAKFRDVLMPLLRRPSMYTALILTSAMSYLSSQTGRQLQLAELLPLTALIMLCCLMTEQPWRYWVVARWKNRRTTP